ncbi:TraR/DksA C4-type zinc finger protein [Geomicrobium sp. JCM 19038]|uniref:TraR/DksA C4-type zinc finger protein n=1 Tax=Geomicrobium sp. JCM 19038 TaxID=1460635 RepID=UPI001EE63FA1|nr:TraR/DksA C4-type zinc finger protein [Geomicrobium sp. JCM 19038]
MEQIKHDLEERKKDIERREHAHEEDGRDNELSVFDNHPADSADIFYEASKDDALHMHRHVEHEEIVHALKKFENGTYGICEETGAEIPKERLLANPTARTVVNPEKPADQSGVFLGTAQGNPSPYSGGQVASDGVDMWEALMNTTEDQSYHESATSDFWVEKELDLLRSLSAMQVLGSKGIMERNTYTSSSLQTMTLQMKLKEKSGSNYLPPFSL